MCGIVIIIVMWSNKVKLLIEWLAQVFLTYNFFSFLTEEGKCDKLCKDISMVSDALHQQEQKEKVCPSV